MNLPHITTKQQEIIKLIYKHRFLLRKQIQQYLNHTEKSRSTKWLKDLKEKQFVDWKYDSASSDELSKPAIYFLNTNGIRFLRKLGDYPEDELRKRYKDSLRQQSFMDRCLLLADCCLHLEIRSKENPDRLHYTYALETDFVDPDNDFYFLSESEHIRPDLVFTKELDSDDEYINQTYFMQLFDSSTPRYMVKKKLKGYIDYLQDGEWEYMYSDQNVPIILIACPTLAELIYAKRYVKKQLREFYDDDIPEEIILRFSTIEKVKAKGVTAVIWENL